MIFPTRKSDILILADRILAGLTENQELFPNPPFSTKDLAIQRDNVRKAKESRHFAQASLKQAVEDQQKKLAELEKLIKQINRSRGEYQPNLPEHFRQLTALVHAHPKTFPVLYLRRFGILL